MFQTKNTSYTSLAIHDAGTPTLPPHHIKDFSFFPVSAEHPENIQWSRAASLCLACVTVMTVYCLWDWSSNLIALKHYHHDHQEPLEVITWILWPNATRKKKIKRSNFFHQRFFLFLFPQSKQFLRDTGWIIVTFLSSSTNFLISRIAQLHLKKLSSWEGGDWIYWMWQPYFYYIDSGLGTSQLHLHSSQHHTSDHFTNMLFKTRSVPASTSRC